MRSTGTILACLTLVASAAAQAISIRELPALARARAERQRPALLAQLEPFLSDLRTDYQRNASILDGTIEKVAALGAPLVPILIDYLTPADPADNRARWLAANAARVLERLEPAEHLDTWLELLDGEHPLGRRAALRLIAAAGPDPRSEAALARTFPKLDATADLLTALAAAERLETPVLAPLAARHLAAPEAELRAAVLEHLAHFGHTGARQEVVQALRRETDNALLGRYVALLQKIAARDEAVADALVPLIEGVRLDPEDLRSLVRALGTIAPAGHRETRRVLLELLERGEVGSLGIEAALTLQAIDEKRGRKLLFDNLSERIRQRRGEAGAFADRGEALFAFGLYKDAIDDYENAVKYGRSDSRQAAYYLQIARCEAHRDSAARMVRALKLAGVSAATIRTEAAKDPVFAEVLQRDLAQRFLESIDR
jgi:hypothetical protein